MMKIVNTTPDVLKHQIQDAIAKAVKIYRQDYPNEKSYFSRNRVLTIEKMVNLLLSMQGGSLNEELYDAGIDVTASAFVQRRNKLSWTIFEDVFENKKDAFVKQEIYSAMIMMNFCNRIVNEIVIQQKQENIHEYKVNMKMAMYLCRQFFRTKNADAKKLIKDISKYVEPVRPDRRDTRNIKAKSFVGFVYRVSA